MAALIRFPDVEKLLPPLLRPELVTAWPGVYVGRDRAADQPLAVLLRRQGGTPRRLTDSPRVGFTVWAPDDDQANELALDTVAALWRLNGNGTLSRLSMTGLAEIQDNSTPYRRRYFNADFRLRGKDITA
jgi:hypothetical protein